MFFESRKFEKETKVGILINRKSGGVSGTTAMDSDWFGEDATFRLTLTLIKIMDSVEKWQEESLYFEPEGDRDIKESWSAI